MTHTSLWNKGFITVILFIGVFCGCQSKDTHWQNAGQPSDYRYTQTQDGVTIAVEPWFEEDKIESVFHADLLDEHILPMRLVIFNMGSETIRFSSTQVKLHMGEEPPQAVMCYSAVTGRVHVNEGAGAAIITIATLGYGAPIAAAVAGGAAGKNNKIQTGVRSSCMELVTLDPNETMAGFVFFDCDTDKLWEVNSKPTADFEIVRMPRSQSAALSYRVPLFLAKTLERSN